MALGDDAPRQRKAPNKARDAFFLRYCITCEHVTLSSTCVWCEQPITLVLIRDETYQDSFKVYDQKAGRWLRPEEV